jgi:bacillolysin
MTAGRHRRAQAHTFWLRGAAVAVGLGAAVATGQGIAAAAPSGASESASAATAPSANSKPLSGSAKSPTQKAVPKLATRQHVARTGTAKVRPTSIGLSGANRLPLPAAPVEALFESLFAAARPTKATVVSQPPATQATVSGQGAPAPTPVDQAAITALRAKPGVQVGQNADGTVHAITGTFTGTTISSAGDAATLLNQLAPVLGAPTGFANAADITVQHAGVDNPTTGDIAETFYRFHDSVNGVPVVGSEVIVVADSSGNVTGLVNSLDTRVEGIDTTTSANGAQAAATAFSAYVGASTGEPFQRALSALLAAPAIKPELVIYALDANTAPQLAWKVSVDPSDAAQQLGVTTDPGSTYYVYANGPKAGSVITGTSNAQPASVATTAKDDLGVSRSINVVRNTLLIFNFYTLHDAPRKISTYWTGYLFFVGPPSTLGVPVFAGFTGWDPAGVSAQANVADAYDYYKNVLSLTSFDGNGAPINISIRYNPDGGLARFIGDGYNNAYWDSNAQQFAFGDAGELDAALDIVAHEYTHAVVSYAVGDGDSPLSGGESGSLNEAYADIMGSLVEEKTGPDRWLMGEDSEFPGGPLRNLADPTSISTDYGPYRDNYADRYTGTGDAGGEHVNSTIFSHAAYLMMIDPATADITEDQWSMVYYHSLYRLSPGATFTDGRTAVLDTAIAYGFTPAQQAAITNAFDEVGITDPDVVVV